VEGGLGEREPVWRAAIAGGLTGAAPWRKVGEAQLCPALPVAIASIAMDAPDRTCRAPAVQEASTLHERTAAEAKDKHSVCVEELRGSVIVAPAARTIGDVGVALRPDSIASELDF